MSAGPQRLLIIASKLGYQTRAFAEAARRAGAEVQFATDRCHRLEDPWGDRAIAVHFAQAAEAAAEIVEELSRAKSRLDGIIALGDAPVPAAAHAARALRLPYNSPESAENCRTKLRQREVLRKAGLPVPEFFAFELREDPRSVLPRVKFPCVVKPLALAASQGVIRADDAEEFITGVELARRLLESPEVAATREPSRDRLLVERYVEGDEVAVEALLTRGELRVLAVFDKPGHSAGPYFEERIYVTPSRLPALALVSVEACLGRAVRALGLEHGPLHCEFRVAHDGPWVLEIQPRPIGGLCARALRFAAAQRRGEEDFSGERKCAQSTQGGESDLGLISLEDLLVRHALGMSCAEWRRERAASGVMMIPVPQSGVLEGVAGVEEARAVPGVDEVHITARLHGYIAAWPEGSSYLGFIFARGDEPEQVVEALNEAHARMRFAIQPRLPVAR